MALTIAPDAHPSGANRKCSLELMQEARCPGMFPVFQSAEARGEWCKEHAGLDLGSSQRSLIRERARQKGQPIGSTCKGATYLECTHW